VCRHEPEKEQCPVKGKGYKIGTDCRKDHEQGTAGEVSQSIGAYRCHAPDTPNHTFVMCISIVPD
jgi:hypothetical protein